MDIMAEIEKAISLINEGAQIAESIKTDVEDASSAHSTTDLKAAQQRLSEALDRAQTAHDSLEDAIARQIG